MLWYVGSIGFDRTQNPPSVRTCGFKSRPRHHFWDSAQLAHAQVRQGTTGLHERKPQSAAGSGALFPARPRRGCIGHTAGLLTHQGVALRYRLRDSPSVRQNPHRRQFGTSAALVVPDLFILVLVQAALSGPCDLRQANRSGPHKPEKHVRDCCDGLWSPAWRSDPKFRPLFQLRLPIRESAYRTTLALHLDLSFNSLPRRPGQARRCGGAFILRALGRRAMGVKARRSRPRRGCCACVTTAAKVLTLSRADRR
jgi:hypothetical protein